VRHAELVDVAEFLARRRRPHSGRGAATTGERPCFDVQRSAGPLAGRAVYRFRRSAEDQWEFMIAPLSFLPSEARAFCSYYLNGVTEFEVVRLT
jgi:hypothetical protein